MIGSHDTFTYLKSTSWVMNLAKRWWKTQNDDIYTQYAYGVRMFDIRVTWYKKRWRLCHGIVNLRGTFDSLDDICKFMSKNCPEAIYRIILERGGDKQFRKEAQGLCAKYPMLWRIDIKELGDYMGSVDNNNQALRDAGYLFAKDTIWNGKTAAELHGFVKKDNIAKINLKHEAGKINSHIPVKKGDPGFESFCQSKLMLLFIDYCTNNF